MSNELELVPICRVEISVSEAIVLENTPTGTLMIGEINASRWEGERFRASLRGAAAADWLSVAPAGTAGRHVQQHLDTAPPSHAHEPVAHLVLNPWILNESWFHYKGAKISINQKRKELRQLLQETSLE